LIALNEYGDYPAARKNLKDQVVTPIAAEARQEGSPNSPVAVVDSAIVGVPLILVQ